MFISSVAL